MIARSLFNENDRDSNLLDIVLWFVLGKHNRQAKKVYYVQIGSVLNSI